uniref:Uncharacterized protein n=1 Tax=Moniliophthora roreri TaxID=221103 RepID=A0A0W0FIB8_MONRR
MMAKFQLNASTIFAPVQIKPSMVSSQLDEIAKLENSPKGSPSTPSHRRDGIRFSPGRFST